MPTHRRSPTWPSAWGSACSPSWAGTRGSRRCRTGGGGGGGGRGAGIKKVSYRRAECDVEIDLGTTGSVLRGDVQAACYGAKTVFRIESDADPAALLEVITLAKHGCFGEAMLSNPVPMTSEIYVNGEPL